MRTISLLLWGMVSFPLLLAQSGHAEWFDQSWKEFLAYPRLQDSIDLAHLNLDLLDAAVFHMSNRVRQENKRTVLRFDPSLRGVADFHARAMAKHDFVSHFNRHNWLYSTLTKRSNRFHARALSENVASAFLFNYQSNTSYYVIREFQPPQFYRDRDAQRIVPFTYYEFAEELVNRWLNSPGHRRNLLSLKATRLGCAIRVSEKERTLQNGIPVAHCVQNFGADRPAENGQ
ncbi:MAG: CAP domain-containing protein [Bacteroidota bacterium]